MGQGVERGRGLVLGLAAAVVSCAGWGCGGGGASGGGDGGAAAAEVSGVPATVSTVQRSSGAATGDDGLEVRWWLADDSEGAVGRALAALGAEESPATETAAASWSLNGVRWMRLPASKLGELEAALPAVQQKEQGWMGWASTWTEVYRARAESGGVVVADVEGSRLLAPGRARLIARCWTAPEFGTEGGLVQRLRLEMTVQSVSARRRGRDDLTGQGGTGIEDQGPVVRGLTVETALDEGFIEVITAERPGVVWGVDEAPAGETAGSGYGPPAPEVRTVGDVLMVTSGVGRGAPALKAVLVLVPRVRPEARAPGL